MPLIALTSVPIFPAGGMLHVLDKAGVAIDGVTTHKQAMALWITASAGVMWADAKQLVFELGLEPEEVISLKSPEAVEALKILRLALANGEATMGKPAHAPYIKPHPFCTPNASYRLSPVMPNESHQHVSHL